MLIENFACDECQLMSGYLVRLGDARPEYVYICGDCLQRGLEEIADARDLKSKQDLWKHFSAEERRWQELNLKRVGLGLAPYLAPRASRR